MATFPARSRTLNSVPHIGKHYCVYREFCNDKINIMPLILNMSGVFVAVVNE